MPVMARSTCEAGTSGSTRKAKSRRTGWNRDRWRSGRAGDRVRGLRQRLEVEFKDDGRAGDIEGAENLRMHVAEGSESLGSEPEDS